MMMDSFIKIYKKIYEYIQSEIYYAPPVLRYTFLNIFGFQVARSLYESIRFRIMQYFWMPHDPQFSSQIHKNGLVTFEDFLDQDQHRRLTENIKKIIGIDFEAIINKYVSIIGIRGFKP